MWLLIFSGANIWGGYGVPACNPACEFLWPPGEAVQQPESSKTIGKQWFLFKNTQNLYKNNGFPLFLWGV